MKHTAIICGSGSSISEYSKEIPELIKKYPSVGLNMFPNSFVDTFGGTKSLTTTYWLILDEGMGHILRKFQNGQELLVNGHITKEELRKFSEAGIKYTPFLHSNEIVTRLPTKKEILSLYGIYSSVVPALNFLFLKGFTNIVLFGIDNKCTNGVWKHFYDDLPEHLNGKSFDQLADIHTQLDKLTKTFKANVYIAGESTLPFQRINVTKFLENGTFELEIPKPTIQTECLNTFIVPDACKNGHAVFLDDVSFKINNQRIQVPSKYVKTLRSQGFKLEENNGLYN